MRKLRQQFFNLDETLPYDEDELQELNMFASGPEEGLQILFHTESMKERVADSETEAGTSTSTSKDTSVPFTSTSRDTSLPSPVVIPDSDVGPSSEEAENSESVGKELVQGMHVS